MRYANIILLISLLPACKYLPTPNGDGETGGDSYEHEPEGSDPPQWWCRERLTEIGHEDSDIETCYYSHATQGWDWKPHWGGLPSVMQWLDEPHANPGVPRNPNYTCSITGQTPIEHKLIRNMSRDEFRSGLAGNFALWLPVDIDGDLRWSPGIGDVQPPIITATFFDVSNPELPTMAGNPYLSGRYNAFGQLCSTAELTISDGNWWGCSLNAHTFQTIAHNSFGHDPNVDCKALVLFHGIAEPAPSIPLEAGPTFGDENQTAAWYAARDSARCLDNGGHTDFVGATASAADRAGLVWVNWSQETIEAMQEYVQIHLLPLDAIVEDLVILLDFLAGGQHGSQEATYWPQDPAYPYQSWSHTGLCHFGVSVSTTVVMAQALRVATRGCPAHMMAILPDLPAENGTVDGFCTYPHVINAPPSGGAAIPGAEPGFSKGMIGHGRYYHYLDLHVLDDDTLNRWLGGFTATPSPDGLLVEYATPTGRAILASLEIPDGSLLLSIGDLLVATGLAGEDDRAVTTTDVAIEINRLVEDRRMIHVVLETPDGTWINRYLSTYTGDDAVSEPPTIQ